MTHNELIRAIKEQVGHLNLKDVENVLEALAAITLEQIESGGEVQLKGIGKLKAVYRAPRPARNPKTGDVVHIPATHTPKMVFFKALKDAAAAGGVR